MASYEVANSERGADPEFRTLLTEILHDVRSLVRQQLELFKHEVRVEARQTGVAAIAMIAAVGAAIIGADLFCFMLVHLLNWAVPALPLWACYGLLGLVALSAGVGLALFARLRFRRLTLLPEQSLATLRENLEWTAKPK